jgi:signal transduction histidine kinase
MNSGKLLHYLVNDMIDLFRIRNGKFSSNETSVDLQDQLEEVMDMFQL